MHSFDTLDLEMPLIPIACATSSTRRVLTPGIHASWMTLNVDKPQLLNRTRHRGQPAFRCSTTFQIASRYFDRTFKQGTRRRRLNGAIIY